MTVSAEDTKRSATSSDFPEDSPNSLPSGEGEMDSGETNVSFGGRDGQCLATVSDFRELSPNSRVRDAMFSRHTEEATHKACVHQRPQRIFAGFADRCW